MSFQYLAVRYNQLYFTVSDLHCLRDVFVFCFFCSDAGHSPRMSDASLCLRQVHELKHAYRDCLTGT